jgi:hypothetical protein
MRLVGEEERRFWGKVFNTAFKAAWAAMLLEAQAGEQVGAACGENAIKAAAEFADRAVEERRSRAGG